MLALCLLAAACVAAAQMLTVCARQRIEAERQLAAQLEANNAAERIAAMSYDKLTSDSSRRLALTPEGLAALEGGELTVELTEPDVQPACKRVTFDVTWPSALARAIRCGS